MVRIFQQWRTNLEGIPSSAWNHYSETDMLYIDQVVTWRPPNLKMTSSQASRFKYDNSKKALLQHDSVLFHRSRLSFAMNQELIFRITETDDFEMKTDPLFWTIILNFPKIAQKLWSLTNEQFVSRSQAFPNDIFRNRSWQYLRLTQPEICTERIIVHVCDYSPGISAWSKRFVS